MPLIEQTCLKFLAKVSIPTNETGPVRLCVWTSEHLMGLVQLALLSYVICYVMLFVLADNAGQLGTFSGRQHIFRMFFFLSRAPTSISIAVLYN